MSQTTLEALGDGRFRIVGDLDYETVKLLLGDDDKLFAQALPNIEVDFGGVGRSTSVGLALMLEWLRQARARDIAIRFSHLPAQMLGLARVSQLDQILSLEIEEAESS